MKKFWQSFVFGIMICLFSVGLCDAQTMASFAASITSAANPPQTLTRAFTPIVLSVTTDTASGWNATTNAYTIPANGYYLITTKLRLVDNTTAGTNFAQGVATVGLTDGPWMVWQAFESKRTTIPNAKVLYYAAGTQINMLGYCDSNYLCTVDSGEMLIQQVPTSASGGGGSVSAPVTYSAGSSYAQYAFAIQGTQLYLAAQNCANCAVTPGTNTAYWVPFADAPNAAATAYAASLPLSARVGASGSTNVPGEPTTNPLAGHIITADGSGGIQDGGTNASAIAMPNPSSSLIAEYDFHEGGGTTVDNIAGTGSSYNWTLTSGTPTGAVTPVWIPGAVGGAGLAMGTDFTNYYGLGLPTTTVGTACQTLPVYQNAAKTVLIQFFNPPAVSTYSSSFALQDLLGSATAGTGQRYYLFEFANLDVYNNTASYAEANYLNAVGLHTFIITYPTSGAASYYLDGQPLTGYATTLYANYFQLGCNASSQAAGAAISAPDMVYHLAFWSTQLTAAQVQQATQFVQTNLAVTKAYQPPYVTPIQGNGANLFVATGDSTTQGTDGGGSTTSYPYAFCLISGTTGCYTSSYTTALPNVNGATWTTAHFGMPGAGTLSFPYQYPLRENVAAGESNSLRVNVIWSGINGLSATELTTCSIVQTSIKYGFQAWMMTLYSLNTTASGDQTSRDPYNFALLRAAKGCGATGVINLAEDAFIGVDGHQGTSPYWAAVNVHLGKIGYAYVAQIVSRVLSNYYLANMSVPTVYSASTVTMNGYDRFVTWNTSSNAIAATLPDCIGMGGSGIPYKFKVSGSNSLTFSPASVTGQTETINGTTSQAFSAGNYVLYPQTLITAASNSGGCDWEQEP